MVAEVRPPRVRREGAVDGGGRRGVTCGHVGDDREEPAPNRADQLAWRTPWSRWGDCRSPLVTEAATPTDVSPFVRQCPGSQLTAAKGRFVWPIWRGQLDNRPERALLAKWRGCPRVTVPSSFTNGQPSPIGWRSDLASCLADSVYAAARNAGIDAVGRVTPRVAFPSYPHYACVTSRVLPNRLASSRLTAKCRTIRKPDVSARRSRKPARDWTHDLPAAGTFSRRHDASGYLKALSKSQIDELSPRQHGISPCAEPLSRCEMICTFRS